MAAHPQGQKGDHYSSIILHTAVSYYTRGMTVFIHSTSIQRWREGSSAFMVCPQLTQTSEYAYIESKIKHGSICRYATYIRTYAGVVCCTYFRCGGHDPIVRMIRSCVSYCPSAKSRKGKHKEVRSSQSIRQLFFNRKIAKWSTLSGKRRDSQRGGLTRVCTLQQQLSTTYVCMLSTV